MQIVLLGLNHRTAPLELRERVAFPADVVRHATKELRARCAVDEAVVLSTCNRCELYTVWHDGATLSAPLESFLADFHQIPRERLNGCLYFHRDTDAVRHLFRVAAGLDSMLLGEAEILGQVREAYRSAADLGATGPTLNRLFQGAIETGKRVRAETELGAKPMSVASAGVKLAERVFGHLERHSAMIVGAGEMAQQVGDHLRHRGVRHLWVTSRQREHAEALASSNGGETVAWEELQRFLPLPDILVASVAAEQPVITSAMLSRAMAQREHRSMFLLDLGVPRNIEPAAASLYNLYLYNIDDLTQIVEQNRLAREREIPRADAIVADQVAKFEAWRASRSSVDVVSELRSRLDARLRRMVADHADTFTPEQRRHIEQISEQLIDELLREPASRLRSTPAAAGERRRQIETLRVLFGLDSEDK
jgi:glutamyl-tRNA reductase